MPDNAGNEPTNEGDPDVRGHETILQQLDREIGEDFFPKESFENATAWNTVPIIFAQEHPDLEAYDKDPAAELARLARETGRRADIVGTPANARIETKGRPRLMGDLNWQADPEIQRLFDEGKLATSTAFWANTKNGSLDGLVRPHHVLLFEEDRKNQPRDKGAVVLNKETDMKAFTNEGRVLSGKNASRLNDIFASLKSFIEEIGGGKPEPEPVDEEEKPVENKEPEPELKTEDPITNMTEEIIASKDAEIADLTAKLQKIEDASKEAAWQSMKNKLPPGLVHTPELEADTRTLFETDSFAFANKLLDLRAEPTKNEDAAQFVNKDDDKDKANRILSATPVIPGRNH